MHCFCKPKCLWNKLWSVDLQSFMIIVVEFLVIWGKLIHITCIFINQGIWLDPQVGDLNQIFLTRSKFSPFHQLSSFFLTNIAFFLLCLFFRTKLKQQPLQFISSINGTGVDLLIEIWRSPQSQTLFHQLSVKVNYAFPIFSTAYMYIVCSVEAVMEGGLILR